MNFIKFITSVSVLGLIAIPLSVMADVSVRGYYRKDGTYVKPHMRSNKDGNFYNNWSTVGNVNPYTGKRGTKAAPTYSYSSPTYTTTSRCNYPSYQYVDTNVESDVQQMSSVQISNHTHSYPSNVGFNGVNWTYFDANNSDVIFIAQRKKEYWLEYPVVEVMYLGFKTPQGNLTWKGRKILKVVVNCQSDMVAAISETIIDSQEKIVSNVVVDKNQSLQWQSLEDAFGANKFKSISNSCDSENVIKLAE